MEIIFIYTYVISINLVTFLIYGYDKYQARKNGPRISEKTLHIMALIGGSGGAFLGQILFRHKTRKWKFKVIFIIIVVIQIVMILYWVCCLHESINQAKVI